MTHKLALALTFAFASASFASLMTTQITLGPGTNGLLSIGTNSVSFAGISGLAYLGNPSGTFTFANSSISFSANNSMGAQTFAPNSGLFTVDIGTRQFGGLADARYNGHDQSQVLVLCR